MGLQVYTLGCRLNQADSEEIKESFAAANSSLTSLKKDSRGQGVKDSNICIVNTCCVTKDAEVKSKKLLRRVKRNNPNSLVIATGCLVKANKNNIFKNIPADLSLPKIDFKDIKKLENWKIGKLENLHPVNSVKENKLQVVNNNEQLTMNDEQVMGYELRIRRFIKIQDGCNRYCAFCVVPFARSKVYSRSPEEILKQIKNLAKKNIKEVVLTAACLGLYNYGNGNNEKINLAKLIKIINKKSKIKRLRLTSIDPEDLSDEFINNFSQSKNFCPHLHLSLQSGSNKILKSMKRNYTAEEVREKINNLKNKIPALSLSADILVGFPNESAEDFWQTIKLAQELNIYRCHIFAYSDRPNTLANYLKNKISAKIKKQRAKEIKNFTQEQFLKIANNMLGQKRKVLIEEFKNNFYLGYTEDYFKVKIISKENIVGKIVEVKLEKLENNYFLSNNS